MTSTAIEPPLRIDRRVRQQRHGPRPLDGDGQLALVAGTVAGDPAGDDLAPLTQEVAENARVLVVDEQRLVGAEPAHLAPADAAPAEAPPFALPPAFATVLHRLSSSRSVVAEV